MIFLPFCLKHMTSFHGTQKEKFSKKTKLLFSMQSQMCQNILSRAVNLKH